MLPHLSRIFSYIMLLPSPPNNHCSRSNDTKVFVTVAVDTLAAILWGVKDRPVDQRHPLTARHTSGRSERFCRTAMMAHCVLNSWSRPTARLDSISPREMTSLVSVRKVHFQPEKVCFNNNFISVTFVILKIVNISPFPDEVKFASIEVRVFLRGTLPHHLWMDLPVLTINVLALRL